MSVEALPIPAVPSVERDCGGDCGRRVWASLASAAYADDHGMVVLCPSCANSYAEARALAGDPLRAVPPVAEQYDEITDALLRRN